MTTVDSADTLTPPSPLPWSRNALGRLGKCLVKGTPVSGTTPDYAEVMLWYNELTGYLHSRIEALDFTPVLGSAVPDVTSRSKTIDTLTEKLVRHPSYQLPNIQDICGARIECDMSLSQQTQVTKAVAEALSDIAEVEIKDYRAEDHSGYRAVHLWLTFPTLGARAEVQIRTHLQATWANTYERAADRYGRSIRYGEYPENPRARRLVEQLQHMSREGVHEIERLQETLPRSIAALDAARRAVTKDAIDKRSARRWRRRIGRLLGEMQLMQDNLYDLKTSYTQTFSDLQEALSASTQAKGD